jgi:galactokinase
MESSHASLCDDYEVSSAALDAMVEAEAIRRRDDFLEKLRRIQEQAAELRNTSQESP